LVLAQLNVFKIFKHANLTIILLYISKSGVKEI